MAHGLAGSEFIMAVGRLLDGRYQTERLLGSGGMAAVWRGRDLRLDRPVAIKELAGKGMGQPKAQERFDREARAVGRLSHPNIVSVYDFGTQDGDPYLVMELVEGPTVAKLLEDGPLPVADALAIASQTCDGLAAAHAAGVIHRDIKPANLILTNSGMVKICDFGVAQISDAAGHAKLTASAIAMGSPMYMAPEQINGEPVDPRTDLYALGCTLYAMLAGSPPFFVGSALSIAHQQVANSPEPLCERRPEVPPAVEALVGNLLTKTPDGRPSDAAAVRARIAAVAADAAADAAPSTLRRSAVLAALVPLGEPGSAEAPPAVLAAGLASPSDGSAVVARAGEAAADAAPEPTGGSPPRATRRFLWAGAAVAMAAAVVLVLLVLRPGPEKAAKRPTVSSAPIAAIPPPSGVPSSSAVPSPSVTHSPSAVTPAAKPATGTAATSTPTAPALPTDPIVALRQRIQQQVNAGNLTPATASDLNHMVDDLAKAITTGNTDDETKKLKALQDKLTSLFKEGKLSAEGYRVLSGDVDQIAAKLD
jgi:eukaryotic-like serine/threonine-protein kinase